jgi:hypothetical protein
MQSLIRCIQNDTFSSWCLSRDPWYAPAGADGILLAVCARTRAAASPAQLCCYTCNAIT